ncbi:hypothetical protein EVAR_87984_1 [Eumeta japonica]|uniref:Uncharacterized protein n=1 Tax=Eumeta variegata TaxID=151549 RepID=A0A4C1VFG1_EUMVA|nr:hypothetical protein EVAR_87984_1 [Eumeta japonica]
MAVSRSGNLVTSRTTRMCAGAANRDERSAVFLHDHCKASVPGPSPAAASATPNRIGPFSYDRIEYSRL